MRKFLLMPVAIGVVAVFGGSVARTAPATTIASDAIPNSASVAASGRVTAHLTKTSFTAAQAESVKLVYAFSPASARFGYLLSLKKGANWMKVRSVSKTGSFKGSYTMTVKKLFGSNAVTIGQYRVKVSADANSVTRGFTVTVKATNHPPTFPLRVGVSGVVNTNSYDALGGLVGVTTSMTIDTPATDIDGDPLSYRWTVSNGSIAGTGLSAMWTRVLERNPEPPVPGRPHPPLVAAPGAVTVTATDGRGGTATHDLVCEIAHCAG